RRRFQYPVTEPTCWSLAGLSEIPQSVTAPSAFFSEAVMALLVRFGVFDKLRIEPNIWRLAINKNGVVNVAKTNTLRFGNADLLPNNFVNETVGTKDFVQYRFCIMPYMPI